MKIKLTYNHLTVEINAEGLDASMDALLISSAVLDKTFELHYGKPQLEMNMEDLKVAPTPKP